MARSVQTIMTYTAQYWLDQQKNVRRMKLSMLALFFWLFSSMSECYRFKSSRKSSWLRKKTWLRDTYCDMHQVGKQGEFDYYILAEQYSTVLCHSDNTKYSCENVDLHQAAPWTIHGLWPSYRDGGYRYHYRGDDDEPRGPSCCDPNGIFDDKSIQSLLPRLQKDWSDLKKDGASYGLWKHEWMKHGTCCPSTLQPEKVYFSTVLKLYEKGFNFEHLLQQANITPSTRRTYSVSKIVSAFENTYQVGVVSEILCSNNNSMDTPKLMEIRICLNKDFNPTKCLGLNYPHIGRECGGGYNPEIMYPPTQYSMYH